MKLLEQYLAAVGTKLPWRIREDVKQELRSLLMDEIEERYGSDPTRDELGTVLTAFGSPSEVAARYRGDHLVIGAGFTDLYFLVLAVMVGALAVAFTVVFVVEYLLEPSSGGELFASVMAIPLRVIQGGLVGTGSVTVVFIILSRMFKDQADVLGQGWSISDLENVTVDPATESRMESIVSISFLAIFIVLVVTFPGVVTVAENLFARSGLPLGHRLDLDVFRWYAYLLAILWSAQLVVHVLVLSAGLRGRGADRADLVLSAAGAFLMGAMLLDRRLYATDGGWLGFKVVFMIVLLVSGAEVIGGIVKEVRRSVTGGEPPAP